MSDLEIDVLTNHTLWSTIERAIRTATTHQSHTPAGSEEPSSGAQPSRSRYPTLKGAQYLTNVSSRSSLRSVHPVPHPPVWHKTLS